MNNDFCFLPNIITMVKSKRIGRAENVADMGENRDAYAVLVGEPE
jgi:hypothetical protein